jgi:hypothetical protein
MKGRSLWNARQQATKRRDAERNLHKRAKAATKVIAMRIAVQANKESEREKKRERERPVNLELDWRC